MQNNLLDSRNDYTGGQFSSLHIDNQTAQSGGLFTQRKTVKSWIYYGLVSSLLLVVILCIVFASGWASAADHIHNEDPTPPIPPVPVIQADLPNVLLPIVPKYPANTLMGQVKTFQLIELLSSVYRIAMDNGGNRSIFGTGFNATVEFLLKNIAQSTNLVNVERTYFPFRYASEITDQSLSVIINGTSTSYPTSDWKVLEFSQGINRTSSIPLIYVPNRCDSTEWPIKLAGDFWIVAPQNMTCSTAAQLALAETYGASGVVMILTSDKIPHHMTYHSISVSAEIGNTMIDALTAGTAVSILPNFKQTSEVYILSNICGDTPAGDPTSVVLVGGHSDGVSYGPGVNDDGSGSVATLVLAMGVTKLMQNGSYPLPNMIKFCWFGGEELGLLGSYEVVRQGLLANADPDARVGSRAKDWAMMIDLDMLGSMNFQNYIYDANNHFPDNTPVSAFNGSRTQTNLFFEFFQQNGLPADSDKFDGRSDYGPFLEVGIPAGGVDAGADKVKNESTRIRYQEITGWGGIAGADNDQCYHQPCDTIANIHWGVYTNMTMSAAYVLEKFATRENLREWIDLPINEEMPNPKGKIAFGFPSRSSHDTASDEMR